jgi:hypothetical protein
MVFNATFINASVIYFYPAMATFANQYSLPNNFFDIGKL